MFLGSKGCPRRKNIPRGNPLIRDCDLAHFAGLSLPELHFWMRLYLSEDEHFYECTLTEARNHKMGRAVLGMRPMRLSVQGMAKRRENGVPVDFSVSSA
jgi:hypothetical protein